MLNNKTITPFLEISYEKLEELNLTAIKRSETIDPALLEKEYREYFKKETKLKAITLCFSDLEGRLHMLDYDKKFFLGGADNLTFDGSSIKGFSDLNESDLRLGVDWSSIRYLPSDIFGPGKVIMFANILTPDRKFHPADFRSSLAELMVKMAKKDGVVPHFSAEVEGFLMKGTDVEQNFNRAVGFTLASQGGYYHSLPLDELRQFIDRSAEVQRAMGFMNEKDHPEVAPSQFELNFSYSNALLAADNILLYKLVCRQVANTMGMTATFLPKPIAGVNGSGMHLNISLIKGKKNLFFDDKGKEKISKLAWGFIDRILNHAPELCLVLNPSVNAYRRLDPNFEAPNQIKVSASDRGAMIRIPAGNAKSARIEIRSVAPDINPYLAFYTILRTGLEGTKLKKEAGKRDRLRFLPSTIYDAIRIFKSSDLMKKILGDDTHGKYISHKQVVADRSPKSLGTIVKTSEVIYHHEVTNQVLWNRY
ncbi:MAG: glutamine synthetase family protein [Candidatus Pacebacteria bacterium]|nr:glutamine synthetase family protein [Candidatus Paceibacterota bacterium]